MKRVALDDATHETLKELADQNGRTIMGQLKFIINQQVLTGATSDSSSLAAKATPIIIDQEAGQQTQTEKQQLMDRLKYFDEDSPEYQEALAELQKLQ